MKERHGSRVWLTGPVIHIFLIGVLAVLESRYCRQSQTGDLIARLCLNAILASGFRLSAVVARDPCNRRSVAHKVIQDVRCRRGGISMFRASKCAVATWVGVCIAAAPLAFASPSITGVAGGLSAGQTVTITGSGFGSKPQAQPVLWDNFENGTIGKQIQNVPAAIGHWDTGAGSENVTYTDAKAHTGKMAARHDFIKPYIASLSKNMTFTRLYMDFWMVVDYVDIKSRNFKPWRLYGDNDNYQLDYLWMCNNANALGRVQANAHLEVGSWGGPQYSNGGWMHMQLVYNESSPGQADGTVRHFINSQVAGLDSGAVLTQNVPAHFDQIRIGHYWDQPSDQSCPANGGALVYVDDVYIDTSWARVELGDAPTYAASTHREIQVASSWADGSVSVNFNPGTFVAGSTTYLFVTDANNITSPGIPVKIIGGVAPEPPNSLSVH
jgi:hypothetical protein